MIVITGANGFIGSAIAGELNRRGRRDLICTDHVTPSERPGPLQKTFYQNFFQPEELLEYLKSPSAQRVSCIIHMGACSDTTETDVAFLQRNNTFYTQNLFKWCAQNSIPLIYASSAAVYGAGELGFDDSVDSDRLRPLNAYGESKVLVDRWVHRQSEKPPVWFGLRFFNVYGPNEYHKGSMASVVYKAVQQIQVTGRLRLFRSHRPDYEDGKQMRDFVYVKDVVHWMLQLMERKNGSGIYNMGYGQARTWLDLARPIFARLNKPMKIEWIDIPPAIRPQYQYFTEAKTARLLKSLDLKPPCWSLEMGITDYLENYLLRADPYF